MKKTLNFFLLTSIALGATSCSFCSIKKRHCIDVEGYKEYIFYEEAADAYYLYYGATFSLTNKNLITEIEKPTCTKDGIYRAKCADCHKEFTFKVPSTGHHYTVTRENVIPKTCLEDGEFDYVYTCDYCGDVKYDHMVEKAYGSHSISNVISIKPHTTGEFTSSFNCSRCKEEMKTINVKNDIHKYKQIFL